MRGGIIPYVHGIAMVAMLSCTTSMEAFEIPAGAWEIGGDFDLTIASSTDTQHIQGIDAFGLEEEVEVELDRQTLRIDGGCAYYPIPNLGLGLQLGYEKLEEEVGSEETEIDLSTILIAPMAIYSLSLNESISLRMQGNIGYALVDADQSEADGLVYGLGLGLGSFINQHVALNAMLRYERLSLEWDADSVFEREEDSDSFGLYLGFSVFLH